MQCRFWVNSWYVMCSLLHFNYNRRKKVTVGGPGKDACTGMSLIMHRSWVNYRKLLIDPTSFLPKNALCARARGLDFVNSVDDKSITFITSPMYRTSSLERVFDWGLLTVPEPVIAAMSGIRGHRQTFDHLFRIVTIATQFFLGRSLLLLVFTNTDCINIS